MCGAVQGSEGELIMNQDSLTLNEDNKSAATNKREKCAYLVVTSYLLPASVSDCLDAYMNCALTIYVSCITRRFSHS